MLTLLAMPVLYCGVERRARWRVYAGQRAARARAASQMDDVF